MRWSIRFRSWLHGIASSWLGLTAGLLVLAALGTFSVVNLQSLSHREAVSAATEDARVIAILTANRDVHPDDLTSRMSALERADLRADVDQLVTGRYLLGLTVRRLDGTVLFARGVSVPTGLVERSGTSVQFFTAPGSTRAGRGAVGVVLPLDVTVDGRPDFQVGIALLAEPVVAQSGWASGWLTAAIALVLLLAAGAMVSGRQRLSRQEHRVSHDALTGLGNRLQLEARMGKALGGGEPFGVMVVNLDGFKRVNDALGHVAGDELLRLVAAAMRAHLRPGDLLVRLVGDEFAVLMPGVDETAVHGTAERLLAAVRIQFEVRGVTVDGDASVGAAMFPRDGHSVAALLRSAELAMYQAKGGKLGVCVDSQTDGELDANDLRLLVELRDAITGGQLRLHYQPAVALQPGAHDFVEALVRWQHPERGLIPPGRFIPLAEDTSLIHVLTEWVLDEAARQCAAWRLDGLDVRVAVNISPRSLTYPGLVQLVGDTLFRHGLPAAALHLEVTESAVISRPEVARDILIQLQQRGITTLIDDFGTGYTSLAHLKTLPVDVLKIDRGFVQHMCSEPADETIVRSVIGLAHGLGMAVVAEGVEDEVTRQRLSALGCDIAQGFHLSRPLPAAEATRWLLHQRTAAVDVVGT
jgi:diguanylate cyclase (GGDEF)-like protein